MQSIARTHPTLGVGCHIVLTDGAPSLAAWLIRSLIGTDGNNFRPSLVDFVQALLLGRIKEEEVALEALAQIERLERAGINPLTSTRTSTRISFPPSGGRCWRSPVAAGPAIRNPFEPEWSLVLNHGSRPRRLAVRLIGISAALPGPRADARRTVLTTDRTVGSATGQLTSFTLGEILRALPSTGVLRDLLPSRLQRWRPRPHHHTPARPPRCGARISRGSATGSGAGQCSLAYLLPTLPRRQLQPLLPRM